MFISLKTEKSGSEATAEIVCGCSAASDRQGWHWQVQGAGTQGHTCLPRDVWELSCRHLGAEVSQKQLPLAG